MTMLGRPDGRALAALVRSPHTGIIVADPNGDLGYCFQVAPFIKGVHHFRL
jgi:hypothetical protein